MTIKVGINGLGRIGRMIVRAVTENEYKDIEIKHINNRSNSETSCLLLKHDSIHGKLKEDLKFDKNSITLNKKKISFSQETNIDEIKWKIHNVDYVFECTGKFNSKEKLIGHLIINKKKISFSQETNLDNINWKKFNVDYVFECTGKFNSKEKLISHLNNGAKKVIVSAPCKGADKTIVLSDCLHGAETITFLAPFFI